MIGYILMLAVSTSVVATLAYKINKQMSINRPTRVSDTSPTTHAGVSVCVAARNETHALSDCLERVLASDYDKLEILVLDDASDDDTSTIIKSFAHAGVRFIAGKELPENWIGKNHAYQTLLEEASGEYVLFLDVDTALATNSISRLMEQIEKDSLAMLSVLPQRIDGQRLSAVFGTMRYVWELLLSTKDDPAAASALWVANRPKLQALEKGLAYYKASVRLEQDIARQMLITHSYRYITRAHQLGVSFAKRWSTQFETAVRLYYPAVGRRAAYVVVAIIALLSLLVPVFIVALAPSTGLTYWAASVVAATGILFLHVARSTHKRNWILRGVFWPVIIVQEVVLLIVSYVAYATNRVTWKGRAITAQPVNHSHYELNE